MIFGSFTPLVVQLAQAGGKGGTMTGSRRQQHHDEVRSYLQGEFPGGPWQLSLPPHGRGHETYLARRDAEQLFVKLGANLRHYEVLATAGITAPVASTGRLPGGKTILVQQFIPGRIPTWSDFRDYLAPIATILQATHHSQALQHILPGPPSTGYRELASAALARVRRRWLPHRDPVPAVAAEVDETLTRLEAGIATFAGSGPVASHNDPCNGNWLIAASGAVYLLDLDAMSLDDPAHDLGALLWWYYPPALWPRFLAAAGYDDSPVLRARMRVRMALHCLDITLPRTGSFDPFDPAAFPAALRDFRAVAAGRDNPHGYDD